METISFSQECTPYNKFQHHINDGYRCRDFLKENHTENDPKNSIDTSDSHSSSQSEDTIEFVEDSIMSWFGMKGISNGNPEDVIEKARQSERKLKRTDYTIKNLNTCKRSSLMERRKFSSSN